MHVNLYTDGGARGNPGPAALGVVIKDEAGKVIKHYGSYLGECSNNVAEYQAIVSELRTGLELGATSIDCYADSKLVIEQLKRNWKVKHPDMQTLFVQAWNLMQKYEKVTLTHIRREKNTEADAEVNIILDRKA